MGMERSGQIRNNGTGNREREVPVHVGQELERGGLKGVRW